MRPWILVFLLTTAPAAAESLFVQTQGGTVSIVKDLDAKTCETARLEALGLPATDEEKAAARKADDERDARIKTWRDAHHCDEADRAWDKKYGGISLGASTSGPSFVAKDGKCFVGVDLDAGMVRQVFPSDVMKAECLK